MKTMKGLLITLILFATSATAQESIEKLPPSIRTNGEAIITAKPDRAQIDVGIVTQANSSQTAATQNAQKLETALTQLRKLLGTDADLKTISYSLSPNYRYPTGGGEPTISGYTTSNILRVTLDDLTRVGKVIDTATSSGVNRIQNLQFTLKDGQSVEAQALSEASLKARKKAETLASALGLKIVRVLSITESSPVVIPMSNVTFARAEKAATPIEPGTIEVRATVALTVEISAQ